MSDQTHIVTKFDEDLIEIEGLLIKMAERVREQILDAGRSLRKGDAKLAKSVIKADAAINELEMSIDERAIRLIALRQPMAEDLRAAITTLKISANLERMGDYAKTMSYRVRNVEEFFVGKSTLKSIDRMCKKVAAMLDQVMEGYAEKDLAKANAASDADEEINEMNDSMFRELLTYMMENPRNIEVCTHLLFIAKNLERAGDQVKNIAEQVNYLVTGELSED